MALRSHDILNRVLPAGVRRGLRRVAVLAIPSMRHLDMPTRLSQLARAGLVPQTIYDVGAAAGEWARLAHRVWPSAAIIGFEPNASRVPALERTRAAVPSFSYVRAFLGEREEREVRYSDRQDQTSLFLPSEAGASQVTAPMRTLDSIIAAREAPLPDLIKLDVQGYELQALRGGTSALHAAQAVLMEVSWAKILPGMPAVEDVAAFMRDRGFAWYDVLGILRRPDDDALWQMDALFLKLDHPLRRRALRAE